MADPNVVWIRHDELQDGMIIVVYEREFRVSEVRRAAEVTMYRADCTEASVNDDIRGTHVDGAQWGSLNSQPTKVRREPEA